MLLEAGVIVSIIGLIIGIYQWRKQRGDVHLKLLEIQATIHIKVRSDSSTRIIVRGIAYQVRSNRIGLRRFLSELRQTEKDAPIPLLRRLKLAWWMHSFISMGWCQPIANDCGDCDPNSPSKEFAFAPIAGPSLPTTIDGYDDVSWAFDTRQYAGLFRAIREFSQEKPRLRFIARVSGHPRREVKSSWLKIEDMHAFAPSNSWLFEGVEGWPSDGDPE